jgi:hypothetical protein
MNPLCTLDSRKEEENHQITKIAGKLLSTRADMVFPRFLLPFHVKFELRQFARAKFVFCDT